MELDLVVANAGRFPVKETIALLWAVNWAAIGLCLYGRDAIGKGVLGIVLGFAFAGGLAIELHGVVKRVKAGIFEFETAVEGIKEQAVAELKQEVAEQRESVNRVVSEAEQREEKLREVVKMAKPPVLSLMDDPINTKIKSGLYEALFVFRQSKQVPPGAVGFRIRADMDVEGRIMGVVSETIEKLGKEKLEITEGGKLALLSYQPAGATVHRLKVTVSGPVFVEISGSHIDKDEPVGWTIE